ncbi:hypothetical protein [Streptomyces sp. DT171]|uniref:hypothetical protein n=1 Tax=Streptomyces sp. DT171 TaxID=3416524 RepID=UPI003CF3C4F5
MFLWAALTYLPDGTVRTLAVIAGTAACCAFLAMGAAMRKAPLPEEQPACRMREPTPDERWWCTALVALLVQVALVCVGMATG